MRGTSLCTSPGLRSTCGPPAFPTGGRSSGPDRSALSGQGLYWAPDGDLWVIAYDCPPSDIELGDDDLSDPAEMSILNFDGAALKSVVTLRDPVRRSRFPDHRLLGSVQPLGSDEVLLVAARTAGEPNAQVVDLEGVTVREFMLGDGIYDVQTTRAGEIWVSYYDQGTSIGCWPVQETSDSIPYSRRDFSKPIDFERWLEQ